MMLCGMLQMWNPCNGVPKIDKKIEEKKKVLPQKPLPQTPTVVKKIDPTEKTLTHFSDVVLLAKKQKDQPTSTIKKVEPIKFNAPTTKRDQFDSLSKLIDDNTKTQGLTPIKSSSLLPSKGTISKDQKTESLWQKVKETLQPLKKYESAINIGGGLFAIAGGIATLTSFFMNLNDTAAPTSVTSTAQPGTSTTQSQDELANASNTTVARQEQVKQTDGTPEITDAVPSKDRATSEATNATPSTSKATPEVAGIAPSTDKTTPEVTNATPSTSDGTSVAPQESSQPIEEGKTEAEEKEQPTKTDATTEVETKK